VASALPAALQKKGISITRFTPLHSPVWRAAGHVLREISFHGPPRVFYEGATIPVAAYEVQGASVPTVYFKDVTEIPEGVAIAGREIDEIFLDRGPNAEPLSARAFLNAFASRFFYQGGVYPPGDLLGEKFLFATQAALALIQSGQFGRFDLIHFNDWHFSLMPTLIRYDPCRRGLGQIATVGTVHNPFSYHYPPETFEKLTGLSRTKHAKLYDPSQGLLYDHRIHFLRGFQHADMTNTVSPAFAKELLTQERGSEFGEFFVSLHNQGRFIGVVNGIDGTWDPVHDNLIPAKFSAGDLSRKAECKAALRKECGLKEPPAEAIVFGVLARMTPQKGFDILIPAIRSLVQQGAQFAFVCRQVDGYEYASQLKELSRQLPGMVGFRTGGPEALAHLLYAGCDAFIRPSYYEPCGLSQMIAMKYGAPAIVHRTGGLADTVLDIDENPNHGNGFVFSEYSQGALQDALQRAAAVFLHNRQLWQKLVLSGMNGDYSWDKSVGEYLKLYERALENAHWRNASQGTRDER
jgi:starch synthase